MANPESSPSLRSLTLRRIAMEEESLLSLVHSYPGLEDLVLVQAIGIANREPEVRGNRIPNDIIDGVDMRYLAQLRDVVEALKCRLPGGNMSCWPNMDCLEIVRKDARPWTYTGTVEKTEANVHLMRPDIELYALWK
ncbi:hypothetical protein BGW39_004803 [Mortierella sp. 14UC]|nr:hypothetical protein BGW39_004803 [Mortierella sp. 14UC]